MFTFTPKKDEELSLLLPPGEYEFVVASAVQKTSKSNNPMIQVSLKIWDKDGLTYFVNDYLMTGDKRWEYKLKQFFKSIQFIDQYEKGEVEADMLCNKEGRVVIGIQQDTSGKYPDKNNVSKYVDANKKPKEPGHVSTIEDDDVPF